MAMHDSHDPNRLILNGVANNVRKSVCQRPANRPITDGISLRGLADGLQLCLDRRHELRTQSLALTFIPLVGALEIGFGPKRHPEH